MDRRIEVALGVAFIAVAIFLFVDFRINEVQTGQIISLDSFAWLATAGSISIGVFVCMQGAYSQAWANWRALKRLRAVALGGALVFFSLSAADILIVWTAGFNLHQGLINGNTTLIEGISFREWVTELGLGAFLTVLGLVLDLAEKERQPSAEGYFD